LVLGEGFNTAWSARTATGSLGATQLVDGNANGWWMPPSGAARTVTMSWTAQRPLTVALIASLLAVLALLALVVTDRRRMGDDQATTPPVLLVPIGSPWTTRAAGATATAALVSAALLIGWPWAVLAGVMLLPAMVVRRSRIAAWVGLGTVATTTALVTLIVARQRPAPTAGWPARFEWLHGWTLLGVLLLCCATLFADDGRRHDDMTT